MSCFGLCHGERQRSPPRCSSRYRPCVHLTDHQANAADIAHRTVLDRSGSSASLPDIGHDSSLCRVAATGRPPRIAARPDGHTRRRGGQLLTAGPVPAGRPGRTSRPGRGHCRAAAGCWSHRTGARCPSRWRLTGACPRGGAAGGWYPGSCPACPRSGAAPRCCGSAPRSVTPTGPRRARIRTAGGSASRPGTIGRPDRGARARHTGRHLPGRLQRGGERHPVVCPPPAVRHPGPAAFRA